MQFDYIPLKQKMLEKRVTVPELANRINMKYSTLKSKLDNNSQFKQNEIILICNVLGIPVQKSGIYFAVMED
jgi:DNA-binding Xre family transcriptional regulator